MKLIFLVLATFVGSNILAAFGMKTCHTVGYGCMPFNQCPPPYWASRKGCKCGSICCNLGKMNACSLAGGTCRVSCRVRMPRVRCPGLKKCCTD
uniref:Putative carboxypeptidase inhibitor n=1 Tax=Rhipicephalus pulchellus TaxID=72859 RepID=L7MCC6_RHIPC